MTNNYDISGLPASQAAASQAAASNGSGTPPVTSSSDVTSQDTLILGPDVSTKLIDRTFGREDDYIELHIYNLSGNLLHSENDFKEYIIPEGEDCAQTKNIKINPRQILLNRGFITGQFQIKLLVLKHKIFNTLPTNQRNENSYPFKIKEISRDKREIRATTPKVTNAILDPAAAEFLSDLESSTYFKEYALNLGNDIVIPCINVAINKRPLKHELIFRTLDPLKAFIGIGARFKITEEISDPITVEINLGDPDWTIEGEGMAGPNFNVDIRLNNSIPLGFKSYDDLLSYNITSSYQHLLNKLEKTGIELNIDYDYIRPVSESDIEETYHFENFSHFSSAVDRLKNFKYKVELIETYDKKTKNLEDIPGATSASINILSEKNKINSKKEKLIKGFDGYEHFLYYTSGTYAWPKHESSPPYTLCSPTSSNAKDWLGEDKSYWGNYGGQLMSASLYDKQNPHNLNKLIPNHITDNLDNALYISFINMIGQHFDGIWTYITKEIWKRLYHNAPYLLKTKGTERGIKALMSCYGVPSTILNIKEYGGSTFITGGPLKNIDTADYYKTFTYQKASLALKGDSGTEGYFIKSRWSSSLTDALSSSAKTIEFRIKHNIK